MSFFINWFDKVFSRKEICTAYRHLTPLRFRRDECKPPSGTARSSLTTGDLKRQMLFPALPRLTSLRLGDFVLLLGRSPKAGQADRQAGRQKGRLSNHVTEINGGGPRLPQQRRGDRTGQDSLFPSR